MGTLKATPLHYYESKYQWDGSEGATNNSIPRSLFTISSSFPYTPDNINDFVITINGETQVQTNYTYSVTNGVATITFTHLTSGFTTSA